MIAVLTALLLAAESSCTPVPEADTLWASRDTRWLFIGELHGTNETPDAFANLVCLAAAKRGPVTVAVEYTEDMQPVFDAWLASDGGKKARAALLAAPEWRRPYQDGRTSAAFLRMFERLRVLHREGKVAAVRGFDVRANWGGKPERNEAMAAMLTRIAVQTDGLVMILVGNVHAMRAQIKFGKTMIRPAAYLLPEGKRVSVNVDGPGGSAWNCGRDGCHVHDFPSDASISSGIKWQTAAEREFDVTYNLGIPFTAAPPAVPGIADTKPPANLKF